MRRRDRGPRFGGIDVLANPAGIRARFAADVPGLADLIRRALPGPRERRRGDIVDGPSTGGRGGFGATGCRHAAGYAMEGPWEPLAGEVEPLGLHVTPVRPCSAPPVPEPACGKLGANFDAWKDATLDADDPEHRNRKKT